MTSTVSVLESAPDRGQGQARDMPVHWALEEVDQLDDVHLSSLLGPGDHDQLAILSKGEQGGDEPTQQRTLASALRQR
ncbi:MAG: hypothetical protein NVS3B5_13520 [Sphingomicrobium sp.]